jgi:phosphatidate cytidylyltransferase
MIRLASAIALGAIVLGVIFLLPVIAFRILACLMAALAAREYLGIVHSARPLPGAAPWVLLVAVTCWFLLLPGPNDVIWLLLVALGCVAIEVLFRGLTIAEASTRFFAPFYIGLPLGLLTSVHAQNGRWATVLLMATVVVSDSAQYYTGRAFGRTPLAPAISPKKTIEGALGGVILAPVFMVLAGSRVLPGAPWLWLALTGLAIVVLGICGDLFESRLKRVAGVKDSSALIPGHGGILDRIDALLFATPAYYLFLRTVA